VSFESRYGVCVLLLSTSAEITLPSALRLRLILVASLSRCPVAPVLLYLSDPAKSTILSLPTRKCCFPSTPLLDVSIVTVKME